MASPCPGDFTFAGSFRCAAPPHSTRCQRILKACPANTTGHHTDPPHTAVNPSAEPSRPRHVGPAFASACLPRILVLLKSVTVLGPITGPIQTTTSHGPYNHVLISQHVTPKATLPASRARQHTDVIGTYSTCDSIHTFASLAEDGQ